MPKKPPPKKAAEFRRKAQECTEIARRMSLDRDRLEMESQASEWLNLAKRLEQKPRGGTKS